MTNKMVFVYDTASENLLQTNGPYKKVTLLARSLLICIFSLCTIVKKWLNINSQYVDQVIIVDQNKNPFTGIDHITIFELAKSRAPL